MTSFIVILASVLLTVGAAGGAGAAEAARVVLLGAEAGAAGTLDVLKGVLEKNAGVQGVVISRAQANEGGAELAPLRGAQGLMIFRGPGPLGTADAELFRDFVRKGGACVVLAAAPEAWKAVSESWTDLVGATAGEPFAGGAPMTVINLFPHPIYAGVVRFETSRPMRAYAKLPEGAQLIMEGTVGEETTPLAWVRQRGARRVCHLVPGDAEVLADSAYQQIVGNAMRWALGRPIPGARAIVQRTFMPNSYPGSIAITFPEGPGVCLDPVRGGINYIWDGDFVDLRPRWLTKQGEPARIFGEIFYQEKGWQPLRPGAPTGEPDFHFRGYALKAEGPEFHYLVGGREVTEIIRAGRAGGIVRSFHVGAGKGSLWLNLEAQPGAELVLRGLERDGERACFPSTAAGEFTIEIRRKGDGGLR